MDAKVRDVEDALTIEDRLQVGALPAIGGHRTDGLLAPYVAQAFSPTSWLDLNLGVRLDDDTRFGEKFSPRMAVGVAPWDGGRLKLIYAEAFRGPSAYELGYSDPNSQIAAPDLGPETVRSVEGSFEQRFGKHRVLFGLFASRLNGLVNYAALGQDEIDAGIAAGQLTPGLEEAYRYGNSDTVRNYGMNAAYEGATLDGRLRFGLNVTAATTSIDFADGAGAHPVTVAPQTFGNARTSYELGDNLPTVALAFRFSDRRLADRAYDGGFTRAPSAPPMLAARATLTGKLPPLPNLSYRLGAEYSFTKVEPYVIGANIYPTDETTRAELAPTRRAQGFVGLEYAFDSPARASEF
jgi:outer membrane receptor protein involved in Fe transport